VRWAMSDSTIPTSQKASLTDAVGRLQHDGRNDWVDRWIVVCPKVADARPKNIDAESKPLYYAISFGFRRCNSSISFAAHHFAA
jgi:hypothetical protein